MSDYPWYIIEITMAEICSLDVAVKAVGEDPISAEIAEAQKNLTIALATAVCQLEVEKLNYDGKKGLIPSETIKQIIQDTTDSPLAELEKVMMIHGWSRIEGLRGDNPLAVDDPYRMGSQAEDEPQELYLKGKIIFREDWEE